MSMKNKLIASSALAAAMVIGGSTYVLPVSADSIAEEVTEIGEEAMERVGTIQVWLNVGELSEPVSKGYCELPTELPPTDGDEEPVEEDQEPTDGDEEDSEPSDGETEEPSEEDSDSEEGLQDLDGDDIKLDGDNNESPEWDDEEPPEDDYVPMSAARFGVIEVSADSVDIDLSGVEFNLMKDGEVIATASTNEEGLAEFTDVAEGDYVIEQVTALDGFEIYSEQAEVTLTVASDESECMTEVQWFNDNEDSEDVEDDKKEEEQENEVEEPEDNGDNESETGDKEPEIDGDDKEPETDGDDNDAEVDGDDKEPEVGGDDKEPETDGDDNDTEDNGDDKEPEVDLPDPGVNLPEEDGDDKEPEAGGDDKEPEIDGDDKESETDGDDKEPETDGDDKEPETDGDDKEPETDGDDKEPETDGDDKEPETDGDDKEPETDGDGSEDDFPEMPAPDVNAPGFNDEKGEEVELENTKPTPKPTPKPGMSKPAMPTPSLSVDGEYMQAGGQSGKVVQTSDVATATSWSLGSLGLAIVNLLKRKRK